MSRAPHAAETGHDSVREILPDLAYQRLQLVNVSYIGAARTRDWVLIDAGMRGSGRAILDAVGRRFGCPPIAIVLTHAHFDHVGVLRALAESWNVPIYAHPAELPFLNGTRSYPAPDATVAGGLMSVLQPFCCREPLDVRRWLHTLEDDGRIPPLPEWRWLHTPGHTSGHVSLWRGRDRTLLAGDALITSPHERAYAAEEQQPELNGPPRHYTEDWTLATQSDKRLAGLKPETIVSGHGCMCQGPRMRARLDELARGFDEPTKPVSHPETSVVRMPVRR